jgi:hypothetical protein
MKTLLIATLALGVVACEQKTAEAPPVEHEIVGEWLEADGPGETALVFRSAGAPDFTLVCSQEDKTVRVSAGGFPTTGSAELFFGAKSYQAPLEPAKNEPGRSAVSLLADAALMQSIAQAKSVRLKASDQFAETGQDKAGKLAAFATTCAGLTMPEGAPKAPTP